MADKLQDERLRQIWARHARENPRLIEVVFRSGPRSVVVHIPPGGDHIAREYGGPVFHRGRLRRGLNRFVRVWKGHNKKWHGSILTRLIPVGFPRAFVSTLYPSEVGANFGEIPSLLTLLHADGSSAQMQMTHRLASRAPDLSSIVREKQFFCPLTPRLHPLAQCLWRRSKLQGRGLLHDAVFWYMRLFLNTRAASSTRRSYARLNRSGRGALVVQNRPLESLFEIRGPGLVRAV